MNPHFGISYYRLKQIDFDGKFEYSKSVVVSNYQSLNARVYPNPNTGNFKLEIGGADHYQKSRVKIVDMQGRILLEGYYSGNDIFQVDAHLNAGIYVVCVRNSNFVGSQKLIVH